MYLTHWGRVTHICVSVLTIIGADNGLSPCRRNAIIWTNAKILLIGPLGTNFNEILIEIHTFLFKKMHLKMSSGKWRPFCLGLNVLSLSFLWVSVFWLILVAPSASVLTMHDNIMPKYLTHWCRYKMDAISHTTFSIPFLTENAWIPTKMSRKFVP